MLRDKPVDHTMAPTKVEMGSEAHNLPCTQVLSLYGRRKARPKKRWSQDLEDFLRLVLPGVDWQEVAVEKERWRAMTENFATYFEMA